ncbi:MAG TPA: hypothetical protein VHV28_02140 [Solirubrobacteraceae bacterium]|jgi:hypothetical protein|nr:hypothetical protein [Solirubrobacteraceae bacterium]
MPGVALATVPWAPAGPLPRRLAPLDTHSIPRPGPAMEHVADSAARTLPGGAVGLRSPAAPSSAEYAAVRIDGDGHVGWELTDLVVDGGNIWAGRPLHEGTGVEVLALTGDSAGETQTFTPAEEDRPRRWRLTGHAAPDAFVLYTGGEGARTLVTGGSDGSERISAAPDDVWLHAFELQVPTGPSITDAGEIDLVTRGPDALHVARITPGDQ